MWTFIDRLNNNNWFYDLVGERLSRIRKNQIKKMTNQKKLYRIFQKKQYEWDEAIKHITDPMILEEILRSKESQAQLQRYGFYFYNRAKLIDKLDDRKIAQELYINAIRDGLEDMKIRYDCCRSRIIDGDFALSEKLLCDIKCIAGYIEKIENIGTRKTFYITAANICKNAPFPLLVLVSRRNDGSIISPTRPTIEFEKQLRSKV
jgi:hypothetical protein